MTTSDTERWDAVRRRDPSADGHFYYSVRTTGVYCRPHCAARLARRENVAFHPSCEAAEQAGFRPCKRCRPNEPSLQRRQAVAITAACRQIEAAEAVPTLAALALAAGMSPFHFHRLFKAATGITPKAYASRHRTTRVHAALDRGETVTEALYDAGFNSSGRFYAAAPGMLGMTPTAFGARGVGVRIRFAVGACSLGAILVAATEAGICAILLGDDPAQLARDLQDRFANAQLTGGDPAFEHQVAQVIAFVDAPAGSFDLPLDIRGTAFQQRVWRALRDIPRGVTASYTEVAASIGQPGAVRAVAQACGANPVAVAIPCHRVVRNDGGLAGYRWGVERKRALLERERDPAESPQSVPNRR